MRLALGVAWKRLNDRLGHQGRALVFLAMLCIHTGSRLMTQGDTDPAHTYPLEYLPLWLRVALWWVPAVVAIVFAFCPIGWARWGYVALVLPIAFRGASDGFALLFGADEALWPALFWCGTTAFVWLLAGWPEPVQPQHRVMKMERRE